MEAVAWNTSFETHDGLTITPGGEACINGTLRDLLVTHRPSLADGFRADALKSACQDPLKLRDELLRAP